MGVIEGEKSLCVKYQSLLFSGIQCRMVACQTSKSFARLTRPTLLWAHYTYEVVDYGTEEQGSGSLSCLFSFLFYGH